MSVRFRLALAMALAAVIAACAGDPPEKEMQDAERAITDARTAGADRYARAELTAAEDALKHAHEAIGDRDYRQALNDALDSRTNALAAAREAPENKARALAAATQTLMAGEAALTEGRARLKGSRTSARTTSQLRLAVADAEAALQKARAAFKNEDYSTVTDTLSAPIRALRQLTQPPDPQTTTAPKGRR